MWGRKRAWVPWENMGVGVVREVGGYRAEAKKKKGRGPENARYEILEVSNSPHHPPCNGSPFYNCLPFPQLRTSTRIHRLFSLWVSGSSGLKTTHRAGAGVVRLLLTTVSPLKLGPKNSLKEKEKWERVSTVCIHLIRVSTVCIHLIIRQNKL